MSVVEEVAGLIGAALDLSERASERERQEIQTMLHEAEAGLRAVAPNGPRIRALVEERRRLRREEAERERRSDEPTGRLAPGTPR